MEMISPLMLCISWLLVFTCYSKSICLTYLLSVSGLLRGQITEKSKKYDAKPQSLYFFVRGHHLNVS